MIPIENAFTKCRYCGIIFPLVPPAGERRHDEPDDVFRGCKAPMMPNPRNPDDPNRCFTCFSCNITEGFRSSGKTIKRRFSVKERKKGGLARCSYCVSTGRKNQFPAFEQECRDNSVGAKLHEAIEHVDVQAVASLLRVGVDPDYARQADIDDTYDYCSRYDFLRYDYPSRKLLWNPNGSIVHDIHNDVQKPTRPLPYVMLRIADRYVENDLARSLGAAVSLLGNVLGIIDEEQNENGLNAVARMLIDAGASLSPAVELVGSRYAYTFENFNHSDWFDNPAVITLWRAQNAIRHVLEQCQKQDHFDFVEYFEEKDKDCFPLTEKAVQASSELRPFYYAYTERRAIARLQSHRSSLFSGRQHNGDFLPALPREIEARIRSLALLSVENPILATQIPDPIAHDSD